jgi:hypothetical protein
MHEPSYLELYGAGLTLPLYASGVPLRFAAIRVA